MPVCVVEGPLLAGVLPCHGSCLASGAAVDARANGPSRGCSGPRLTVQHWCIHARPLRATRPKSRLARGLQPHQQDPSCNPLASKLFEGSFKTWRIEAVGLWSPLRVLAPVAARPAIVKFRPSESTRGKKGLRDFSISLKLSRCIHTHARTHALTQGSGGLDVLYSLGVAPHCVMSVAVSLSRP